MSVRQRWDRLAAHLEHAGVENVRLDERRYADLEYGRVVHGVSRSIILRTPERGLLVVSDKYRNEKWIGWYVYTENADCILTREWPPTRSIFAVTETVTRALKAEATVPA